MLDEVFKYPITGPGLARVDGVRTTDIQPPRPQVIANLTCALATHGMAENTVLVIASDNGGEKHVPGNTFPFKGHKGYYFRGGVTSQAMVHSALLPEAVRGTTYKGHMHVTDWLPTLMAAATAGQWTGSYVGADLDGLNFWPALTGVGPTPPKETVFYVSESSGVIQQGGFKYFSEQVGVGLPGNTTGGRISRHTNSLPSYTADQVGVGLPGYARVRTSWFSSFSCLNMDAHGCRRRKWATRPRLSSRRTRSRTCRIKAAPTPTYSGRTFRWHRRSQRPRRCRRLRRPRRRGPTKQRKTLIARQSCPRPRRQQRWRPPVGKRRHRLRRLPRRCPQRLGTAACGGCSGRPPPS